MSIIPFHAMRDIDNIRREIDRVYRLPFSIFEEGFSTQPSLPFIDIYETDEQIIVSCDLPGLQKKEDVDISIENSELIVSGTERFSGHFRHSVTLPQSVSSEGIKAVYKNGVLDIFLAKINNSVKKSIEIEFEH